MKQDDLKQYLLKVSKEGYSTNDEQGWVKEADGSTTITNSDLHFRMHDNFFGGEPYGGRQIIFLDEKPYWILVYYGNVSPEIKDLAEVYSFLQKALSHTDQDFPVRGPQLFLGGGKQYLNHWDGALDSFDGKESIVLNGKEIYTARYMGGLVDQIRE